MLDKFGANGKIKIDEIAKGLGLENNSKAIMRKTSEAFKKANAVRHSAY
jgi:hypothetical protein